MTTTTKSITMSATELQLVIAAAVAAAKAEAAPSATPAPKEPKTAPKGRKGKRGKAAPKGRKEVTLVTQRSLDRINKANGTKYRKAVCFVEAVRDGKAVLPEGFAFGPKYQAYLASGQTRKEFFS